MLEPHLHTLAALIAEQPDRTLAELKDALGTPASLATIWRAVAALDVTVKKNGPALEAHAAYRLRAFVELRTLGSHTRRARATTRR